ncbi:hypothetical protein SH501x_000487 [Pirellulaceae bacterium SH501]
MASADSETLQRRMQCVRHELNDEYQEIVKRFHTLGEWRSYVKTHPWLCLGTAAIIGYWIVPGRRIMKSAGDSLAEKESIIEGLRGGVPVLQSQRTVREVVVNFLGTAILQGVSNYIRYRVGSFLESSQGRARHDIHETEKARD